ncbi:hypothetical protein GUITHDRAFT_117227 [Guillardia theta CCMP2712]|uniref:Uncharacterized protein n=1 Tax=Guillardia theta (strain CCMP2712) TaxID=905079 RepID=L1IKC6_GUITC|nr:hypothetical protein GUITHDRAFT_117227 [Guillardia theta CCMP2712]EKX36572.1 hypothetical protein GUITHDRAFT_117227 [Guillardia theta CCMP2712]|eukprot:XP_005823552.1 hypothetical protein GUITHDRAFT_117227 [Guillardia theta CCMP2712]
MQVSQHRGASAMDGEEAEQRGRTQQTSARQAGQEEEAMEQRRGSDEKQEEVKEARRRQQRVEEELAIARQEAERLRQELMALKEKEVERTRNDIEYANKLGDAQKRLGAATARNARAGGLRKGEGSGRGMEGKEGDEKHVDVHAGKAADPHAFKLAGPGGRRGSKPSKQPSLENALERLERAKKKLNEMSVGEKGKTNYEV